MGESTTESFVYKQIKGASYIGHMRRWSYLFLFFSVNEFGTYSRFCV